MKFRAVYSNTVLSFTVAALFAPLAEAQDPESDETLARVTFAYLHREQAAAADRLAEQLGPAAEELDTLYELSRLFSEPCDQVRWLNTQIRLRSPFSTAPDTQAAAKAVLAQVTALEQPESAALGNCADQLTALKQQLEKIAAPPKPLWEVADPAQLVERWRMLDQAKKDELKRELTPDQKLTLFSRGIPRGELDLNDQDAWDQPRRFVDELAQAARLPEVWRLLRSERELRAAEREGSWSDFAFPVGDTFQIAHGLLDRALGVDAQDRGSSVSVPNWANVASRFESQDCWAWATLARTLQASDQEDPTEAASQAEALWGKLTQVNQALGGGLWPAVAQVEQAWLTRLIDRSNPPSPLALPLRPDYRSAARDERLRLEEQFLQARDNPAEAFRIIQLAKAADVGLAQRGLRPIDLAALVERFEITKDERVVDLGVFLLLEMIEVGRASGRPAQYYGVMLHAKDWRWTGGGYDSAVIGPYDTPVQLAQNSLDPNVELTDLRIVIAPDGPLDDEWFAYERGRLLECTRDRARGWLYYLPSAPAMNEGTWTLDQTLRFWYRAALRAAQETISYYPGDGSPWPVRSNLYQSPPMRLYAISVGPLPEEIRELRKSISFVPQFKDRKAAAQETPLPVLLTLTGETR